MKILPHTFLLKASRTGVCRTSGQNLLYEKNRQDSRKHPQGKHVHSLAPHADTYHMYIFFGVVEQRSTITNTLLLNAT